MVRLVALAISVAAVLCPGSVFAQGVGGGQGSCPGGRPPVRLLVGDLCPTPADAAGEAGRLRAWLGGDEAAGLETVHVLVQLDRVPTTLEQEELRRAGIELQEYLPEMAWIAAVAVDRVEDLLARPEVVYAARWGAALKVHPRVAAGDWAAWALDPESPGMVMAFVLLHADVELERLEQVAERHGGVAMPPVELLHGATVWIPPDSIGALAAEEQVLWVEEGPPPLSPTNDGVRANMNVDPLHGVPYNLTGDGVRLFVFDGGTVRTTHNTFNPGSGSRVTLIAGDSNTQSHPTHVAGTAAGDGDGGRARGVADGATILSSEYEQTGGTMLFWDNAGDIEADYATARSSHGADLGTNSIGSNTASNGYSCDREGDYGVSSSLLDEIVRGDNGTVGGPVIMTWANGNERSGGSPRGRCGANYLTTAPPSCAKNPIHVGAVNSDGDSMTAFSSWGPCDDGRLKPVVSAPGCELGRGTGETFIYSSLGTSNTAYGGSGWCGTSMATPAVGGTVALLIQEWRSQGHGGANDRPLPALVKAMLIHTARDLGQDGPDFIYGYGAVDGQGLVDLLVAGNGNLTGTSLDWGTGSVSQGETDSVTMVVPSGADELRVSLAWDDRKAAAYSSAPLQNNLDLWLEAPDATVHRPWVLDGAAGSRHLPATRGVNSLDNQEQVVVDHPAAGTWTIRVAGTTVPYAPQSYGLVYEARPDVHDPATCAERLANTGFEGGTTDWTLSGASRQAAPAAGHGSWSLRFGGAASTTHTAYTSVSIPADATRAELSFWWYMTTAEGSSGYGWDFFYLDIRNTSNAVLETRDYRSDGWQQGQWMRQQSVDLLAWAGQTVRVYFAASNDSSLATTFWVDDVSVQTCTAGSGCQDPSGLSNNGAADLNGCADDGVQVTWGQDPVTWGDGGSGTRSYDVLRDGSTIQSGIAYGTTNWTDTGGADNTTYTYAVRYVNGCGLSSTTAGVSASDQVAPATPAAPVVTDPEACAQSGVQVTWGAVSGATGYDLRVDGVTVVTGVTSPHAYDPGNTASHTYEVRATTASCIGAWSPAMAAADGDASFGSVPTPVVWDVDLCDQSGVRVVWSAIVAATGYDLRVDGVLVVPDVTSPWVYDPGDFGLHSYEIRGKNAACGTSPWSVAVPRVDGTPAAEIFFCDRFEAGDTQAWDVTLP